MPPYRGILFEWWNVKQLVITTQPDDPGRRFAEAEPARYPIDGTRNRAKSINAHQRDDVLGGKPSDGAAHFKRNRRKRSPLSTGMRQRIFQSVSAPDADGISAMRRILAAADNLRNTNEFCPCRFLGTDGIIIIFINAKAFGENIK